MRHGILNQLRRTVEAHGQAVENAAVERRRAVAFQPRGNVGQEGEAGGVGLRKAVFAEALYLIEDPLGELAVVPALQHAVDELLLERFQTAASLPRRHGAAQLVGFASAESRRHHCQLDHLLLEYRNAQRAFQDLAHGLVGIADRLQSAASAQIRMHHVALDRPRPHDGDFNHQVVEVRRLEPWQHGHLRPRLHLEDAHAVGALQHRVGRRVVLRNVGHAQRSAEQGESLADGRQHAKAQHIDLQQPQCFEIVLVPLNDGALRHRGVLHRHQLRQGAGGDDEAAHMLRQMPREALYFAHQPSELLDDAAVRICPGGLEALHHVFVVVPPGGGFGQQAGEIRAQAQCLADIADGASRPIRDERGGQCGAVPPVAPVDVLDHFLAPFVLEVDVDVRRLVAFLGDETFEQQVRARWVQLGDLQAEAHRGVGGRTAPLAKNAATAREADNVMHGEKEVLVAELGDERQLLFDQLGGALGHAPRPAFPCARLGKLAQVRGWREPLRHQFARIFVAQFVQTERAAVGQIHGFGKHLARIERGQLGQRLEAAFAVRVEPRAKRVDRFLQANGGQHVLQRLAFGNVQDGAVAGRHRQPEARRQRQRMRRLVQIVVFQKQFQRDPKVRQQAFDFRSRRQLRRDARWMRNPKRQAVFDAVAEVLQRQRVFALGRPAATQRDEFGELAVGLARRRQQDQMNVLRKAELGADDQLDAKFARRQMRLHHPGEGTFVGDGDGLVAELEGGAHQFLGMRSAAQEGVVGNGVQFREGIRFRARSRRGRGLAGCCCFRRSSHADAIGRLSLARPAARRVVRRHSRRNALHRSCWREPFAGGRASIALRIWR